MWMKDIALSIIVNALSYNRLSYFLLLQCRILGTNIIIHQLEL